MKNKLIIDNLHKVTTANKEAAIIIQETPPQHELTAVRLGRYRVDIKKHLLKELKEIDRLVKRLVE